MGQMASLEEEEESRGKQPKNLHKGLEGKKVGVDLNSPDPGLNHEPWVAFCAEFESGIQKFGTKLKTLQSSFFEHMSIRKILTYQVFQSMIFNRSPGSPGASGILGR